MPSYRLEPDDIAGFDKLVPDFISVTSDIDDPRIQGRTIHQLTTILFVCLSASMAGAKSIHAFGEFAEDAWPWIKKCLGDHVGDEPVSHDTIGRLLQKLDPDILEKLLARLGRGATVDNTEDQIAIDGKTLTGTARRDLMNVSLADGGQQPFTTVSAYGVDSGLVLGCHTSQAPGSEHEAIEQLLTMIDLRGSVVTMDAGNAHVKFCTSIRAGKGEYLLCIKGNNARTQELCRQIFDTGVDRPYSEHTETVKGRGDSRSVRLAKLDTARQAGPGTGACDDELRKLWPGLVSVVEITRTRKTRNNQVNDDGTPKKSTSTVYYINSQYLSAEDAGGYIRSHWHVENKLHWTMDVSYGEDASRARSGYIANNLAAIKRMANNMLAAVSGRASRMRFQMKFAIDEQWRNKVWGLI